MKHPMADLTRNIRYISATARGRPRAVTPALLEEGLRMLASGMGVRRMCERLGVGTASWYTAIRPRREPKKKRKKQGLSRATVRAIKRMRREGLTLSAIAERLGLHLNTVHKHLRRARRAAPPHPM